MSVNERTDPEKLWVWLDFETSGLNIKQLTVLEAGWTITDSQLKQKIPVKSRLCAFTSRKKNQLFTPNHFNWTDILPTVVELHQKSGLSDEYRAAPHYSIVRSMGALDQLIIDDLFSVGWDGKSKIVPAGAGLAAFDRLILAQFKSQLHEIAHYRSADSSVACELLGVTVPKEQDELNEFWDLHFAGFSSLREVYFDLGSSRPTFSSVERVHRAGSDVASSLRTARALRVLAGTLDKESFRSDEYLDLR